MYLMYCPISYGLSGEQGQYLHPPAGLDLTKGPLAELHSRIHEGLHKRMGGVGKLKPFPRGHANDNGAYKIIFDSNETWQ